MFSVKEESGKQNTPICIGRLGRSLFAPSGSWEKRLPKAIETTCMGQESFQTNELKLGLD
jgi:hypothetical protein